uniref:Uncharacterized protein n=1 Tax=Oryza rufipogon TaxID=4529 RepID=A0A0E0R7D5_ORYRU
MKLLRAWVSLNGLLGWGPTKGQLASRFAVSLLARSLDPSGVFRRPLRSARTEAASSSSSATPPAVLRPPPHKLLCASSFAQALLRSFDAVAALDATDAAAASLLRDHTALDDGNTRLPARGARAHASNLIVLIQAHAEKSKVKCQESRPSKAFNGYKPTIDFEVTDHGLSVGTRNH